MIMMMYVDVVRGAAPSSWKSLTLRRPRPRATTWRAEGWRSLLAQDASLVPRRRLRFAAPAATTVVSPFAAFVPVCVCASMMMGPGQAPPRRRPGLATCRARASRKSAAAQVPPSRAMECRMAVRRRVTAGEVAGWDGCDSRCCAREKVRRHWRGCALLRGARYVKHSPTTDY